MDQRTGEDLNPVVNKMLAGGEVKDAKARNPDRYVQCIAIYHKSIIDNLILTIILIYHFSMHIGLPMYHISSNYSTKK